MEPSLTGTISVSVKVHACVLIDVFKEYYFSLSLSLMEQQQIQKLFLKWFCSYTCERFSFGLNLLFVYYSNLCVKLNVVFSKSCNQFNEVPVITDPSVTYLRQCWLHKNLSPNSEISIG